MYIYIYIYKHPCQYIQALCSVVGMLVNILNKRLLAGKAQQQVPKPSTLNPKPSTLNPKP